MLRLPSLEVASLDESFARVEGRLVAVHAGCLRATLPYGALGDLCLIHTRGKRKIAAQIIGFEGAQVSLAPFDEISGAYPGATVENIGPGPKIRVAETLVGTVVDSLGEVLRAPHVVALQSKERLIQNNPPPPLERQDVSMQLETGLRGIDTLCPLALGQRIGLLASAGVGKSTLIAELAKNAATDIAVIALVGERGREVSEFIYNVLGEEGLRKAIVVVSTSDEPAYRRVLAAQTATSIAEYFRDQGKSVLLLIDSLTRAARALRDVGLAAGELPVRQGYPARVFEELPKLLERAGNSASGSITAVYTLLSGAEGEIDVLSEEVKSLLDGHIVLSAELANLGQRPAIDYPRSISRLSTTVLNQKEQEVQRNLLRALTRLSKDKDLLMLGGVPDQELQNALALEPRLRHFLQQLPNEHSPLPTSKAVAESLAAELNAPPVLSSRAKPRDPGLGADTRPTLPIV